MITPTHITVYSLRREEFLIERGRQRLAAQVHQVTPERRQSRGLSPVVLVLTAMSAIAGWIATLG